MNNKIVQHFSISTHLFHLILSIIFDKNLKHVIDLKEKQQNINASV